MTNKKSTLVSSVIFIYDPSIWSGSKLDQKVDTEVVIDQVGRIFTKLEADLDLTRQRELNAYNRWTGCTSMM